MRRITKLLVVILLTAECTTTKIEQDLHACFARCAKTHERDSLPHAQCDDLCIEKAKPTLTPTTPAQDLAKIEVRQ
jgi:hypothetical protein